MAGIYINQQIVKTTAEWAGDSTVYPANILLFEKLESGKFSIAVTDGVNTFANLNKVATDIDAYTKIESDEKFATKADTPTSESVNNQINTALASYVKKVEGKDLSSNDYTTEEKNKLAMLMITGDGTKFLSDDGTYKNADNATVGVYMDSKPTEDTLTYTENSTVYNFELGMSAIYPDSESSDGFGISFFKGLTSENKAVWGAGGGGTVSLNETVMISLVSNQDEAAVPDPALIGKAIHVVYGDHDKELVWQGEAIKVVVPANMTYQVIFPTDDNYKCPENKELTSIAGDTIEVKGYYYTEVVRVTVSSDDDSSVVGQKVTINSLEYTWNGETIELKIPHDIEYSVSVDSKYLYEAPKDVTFTASQKTRNISMLYTYFPMDTIIIDQTIHDPATMVSGNINGEIIQYIRNNSHRVLAKKTGEGEVTYCRLDDSDSNKYYDGTSADLTGSEGDVFMKMPEFYYKGTEGDRVQIMFSKIRVDEDFIRWDPNTLIGVYEAHYTGPGSYSGLLPYKDYSQSTWIDQVSKRGSGYQLVDWQMHCVMGCLFYAMYGNTNCQAIIGSGTYSHAKHSGQTNSLGMTDTVAGANGDSQSINFWGLENWWGNSNEWIYDYKNPSYSLEATVNDPVTGGTRSLPIVNFDGYFVSKMKFGKYLDLITSSVDYEINSSSTGFCDYQWWPGSTSPSQRVAYRSYHDSFSHCGVAAASAEYTGGITDENTGTRIAFRGICIEETSVEAFKAIEITN